MGVFASGEVYQYLMEIGHPKLSKTRMKAIQTGKGA